MAHLLVLLIAQDYQTSFTQKPPLANTGFMRSFRQILAVSLVSMTLASVQAVSVNSPMPFYFSGTACRASGGLGSIAVEGYPTTMNLFIGGQLVAHYPNIGGPASVLPSLPNSTLPATLGGPALPYVLSTPRGLSVIFDSTHFPNGTNLTIRFEAWTNLGYFTASDSAPVINRILIYERSDFSGGAPATNSATSVIPLGRSIHEADGWSVATLTSDDNSCSLLAVFSHGNQEDHQDDVEPVPGRVFALPNTGNPDYQSDRTSDIGSGLPPLNSSHQPPISLAFLYSCDCGYTNRFSTLLIPYANYYGGWTEDQSVMAYTVPCWCDQAGDHASCLFGQLSQGETADAARLYMEAYAEELGLTVEAADGSVRTLIHGDLVIYGDFYTRLTSVYTASNVQPIGWYR